LRTSRNETSMRILPTKPIAEDASNSPGRRQGENLAWGLRPRRAQRNRLSSRPRRFQRDADRLARSGGVAPDSLEGLGELPAAEVRKRFPGRPEQAGREAVPAAPPPHQELQDEGGQQVDQRDEHREGPEDRQEETQLRGQPVTREGDRDEKDEQRRDQDDRGANVPSGRQIGRNDQ